MLNNNMTVEINGEERFFNDNACKICSIFLDSVCNNYIN